MERPQYSPEELKRMRDFENLYQFKVMKVGEPLTQRQYDAIHYFFGDVIKKIPDPQVLGDIRFTDKGKPYDASGRGNIASVNGKPIPNVIPGGKSE